MSSGGRTIVALCLVAASALPACESDDGSRVFELGRYCDLASQFEGLAVASGASSEPGRFDGPPDAFSELSRHMGPTMEELQATAPEGLRSDLDVLLGTVRNGSGGDISGTQTASFVEANERIESFRQANCHASPDSGEQ